MPLRHAHWSLPLPSLFLSLLAASLAVCGGREAVQVARLSAGLGQSMGLLVAVWASAALSSALAAWLGSALAPSLSPDARTLFVALALLLGAGELLLLRPRAAPREPTRSAGAILLVMLASQITDAARFLVLALSVATAMPVLAAVGGALGSGAVLTAAWALAGDWERRLPLTAMRYLAAGLLALAGLAAVIAGLHLTG